MTLKSRKVFVDSCDMTLKSSKKRPSVTLEVLAFLPPVRFWKSRRLDPKWEATKTTFCARLSTNKNPGQVFVTKIADVITNHVPLALLDKIRG